MAYRIVVVFSLKVATKGVKGVRSHSWYHRLHPRCGGVEAKGLLKWVQGAGLGCGKAKFSLLKDLPNCRHSFRLHTTKFGRLPPQRGAVTPIWHSDSNSIQFSSN